MRKVAWIVALLLALGGGRWLVVTHRRADLLARLAILQRNAKGCTGHVRGERDLTIWAARLAEATARLPQEDASWEEGDTTRVGKSPLEVWHLKGWALDDASWGDGLAWIERRASEVGETVEVFRTVGAYESLDACSLIDGLEPPEFQPSPDRLQPYQGLRACEVALLRAARAGDTSALSADLEACLQLSERLHAPASALFFAVWSLATRRALLAVEGALPLLARDLDLAELERRLTALAPRRLLVESLEWEHACGLRTFDWLQTHAHPNPITAMIPIGWDPSGDLAAWEEGFELGQRYVRGEGVRREEIERFQERLDARVPFTAMTLSIVQDQEKLARGMECRLALARSALRLLRHGRAGWETVALELDPWSDSPLTAEAVDERHVHLRARREGAGDEEQRDLEWLVTLP